MPMPFDEPEITDISAQLEEHGFSTLNFNTPEFNSLSPQEKQNVIDTLTKMGYIQSENVMLDDSTEILEDRSR